MNKLPRQKVTDILIEAVQNPPLMAKLLEKPLTQKSANRIYAALGEAMYRIGIERPLVALRIPVSEKAQEKREEPPAPVARRPGPPLRLVGGRYRADLDSSKPLGTPYR